MLGLSKAGEVFDSFFRKPMTPYKFFPGDIFLKGHRGKEIADE